MRYVCDNSCTQDGWHPCHTLHPPRWPRLLLLADWSAPSPVWLEILPQLVPDESSDKSALPETHTYVPKLDLCRSRVRQNNISASSYVIMRKRTPPSTKQKKTSEGKQQEETKKKTHTNSVYKYWLYAERRCASTPSTYIHVYTRAHLLQKEPWLHFLNFALWTVSAIQSYTRPRTNCWDNSNSITIQSIKPFLLAIAIGYT